MKPDPVDEQLDNLRNALAWLNAHKAMLLYSTIGMQPRPVISIGHGGVTNKLRNVRKYEATTMGRVRQEGIEAVRWQATVFGCWVEWLEPVCPSMPNVRLHQPDAMPTVLRLLQGGA